MSEEEKFIIKTLKDSQNTYIENTKVERVVLSTDEVKVILNLIEKQQKEIETLKEVDKEICNEELLEKDYVLKNYISKDKIREIVRWIIVIEDPRSNNYRPIKNTSAQDVYEAFYKIRELVKE